MSEAKFYRCAHCGNVLVAVEDGGVVPQCCGEPMELLVPGSTDAAAEKHVPVVTERDHHVVVRVGEVDHPMTEEHHIQWVALASDAMVAVKYLRPGDEPEVRFGRGCAAGGTVYAYCNLHGLWKAEV